MAMVMVIAMVMLMVQGSFSSSPLRREVGGWGEGVEVVPWRFQEYHVD